MATIYIDNRPYEVDDKKNLLEVSLSLGLNLPYFCWHPAMGSVGACRQCAVKQFRDEKDTRGKLVMACMTPAKDGTRISIDDPDARSFREGIVEALMENHPHDCPVCDEGGECHLQDMTLMTGHDYRRYRAPKRTFRNQYLGPFVNHEMNRCIQCYRCVRFYRDYAGGRDFDVFSIHNTVYFGRDSDGVLENEFSGNLVEVCPTGVFTDATLKKHYVRKWDLRTAPSVCALCSIGCNTIPGERYGVLRRVRARYNGEVNGYFLCDRGRYGYGFVNSERRIRHVMLGQATELETAEAALKMMAAPGDRFSLDPAGTASPDFKPSLVENSPAEPGSTSSDKAMEQVGTLMRQSKRMIGIGSPTSSLESNFALRTLVGEENFYQGVPEAQVRLVSLMADVLQKGPSRTPSLKEVAASDAVLILGEDVTNYAPMLALALRQAAITKPVAEIAGALRIPDWDARQVRSAIQDAKGPFFVATPGKTKLEEVATQVFHAAPDDIARLGMAVARGLGADVPEVNGLAEETVALVRAIITAFKGAKHPLVVSGPSLGSEAIIQAAANIAWAANAQLAFTMPEANSFGTGLMGGKGLEAALHDDMADLVVVLENDLYRHGDARSVDKFLGGKHVVVLDALVTPTTAKAELVLPAATYVEADGTFVNNEGRAQRSFQVMVPEGEIREAWRWLRDIGGTAGKAEMVAWQRFDDVVAAVGEALPIFKPILDVAPPADFRIAGMKIARLPQRATGRTAMAAHQTVHEPKPPDDADTPFSFSMEGFQGVPPSPLIPRFWAPGWNSPQAVNKFQTEIGGPLRGGDPGKRLIEPAQVKPSYYRTLPPDSERRDGEWQVVPLYHIFGSEALSMYSPGIAEQAPAPYIALNPDDAGRLQINEGDSVEIALDDHSQQLPAKIDGELVAGVVGVPVGVVGLGGVTFPFKSRVQKVAK